MTKILILYYSEQGATAELARHIAHGVESTESASAVIRTVANVSSETESIRDEIPKEGPPFANNDDLIECDGIIIGSPAYFGNMAAPLKYFFDRTSNLWLSGKMIGKPAGVFTSSSSLHGGQESVLLSMILPLMHHGMLIVGLPYNEESLHKTQSGGTPYGASHSQKGRTIVEISPDEKSLAMALGRRVAKTAIQLNAG